MLGRIKGAVNRRLSRVLYGKRLPMQNEKPIVSFTFDDVPQSAVRNGARILEEHDVCGTFYVAGSLCGVRNGTTFAASEDVAALNDRGHEIGCHTFSHVHVGKLDAEAMRSEVARNAEFVRGVCGDLVLSNFAYPFGDVAPTRKRQLGSAFATCRGINPGINRGSADLALLKSVALYGIDRAAVSSYIERAKHDNGWLIFYTHGVDEVAEEYGTNLDLFKYCVERARSAGCDILTVRSAVGAVAFSQTLANAPAPSASVIRD
jgi:peptidoglycan/xylan/chitin deacetylase (PgdA/CDA1 family)